MPVQAAVAAMLLAWSASATAATVTYSSNWAGGTIASGDTVVLKDGASITGNVMDDGTLQFAATTSVTMSGVLSGTGALAIANTGTFTLSGLASGTAALNLAVTASAGQLTIGATGTHALALGVSGSGRLDVTGGNEANGNAFLGATVDGNGLAVVSSGTWANSRLLYVGHSGTGSLELAGGRVSNTIGIVGFNGGSVGMVLVSGGTWSNGGILSVGGYPTASGGGAGNVILTGGRINNTSGNIGYTAGSSGSVSVSGGAWTNSAALFVGRSGTGSLSVTGGIVSALSGTIGASAGGVGFVIVTGGTLSTAGSLAVGGAGTGLLSITGSNGLGGVVIVGGTLSSSASGTIALGVGGTLQIGTGTTTGVLTAGLVNEGTLVFNRSDASACAVDITGSGAIVKRGAGTLLLSNGLLSAGLVQIESGTLIVGAVGSGQARSLWVDPAGTFDRQGFSYAFSDAVVDGVVTASGGAFAISSDGVLGGTGTINGAAVIAGTHSPGHSPGIQAFTGGLDYLAGSSIVWELTANTTGAAGVTYDQIAMPTGNLSFSGPTTLLLSFNGTGSAVEWTNPFWDTDHSWLVFDVATGTTAGLENLTLGGSLLDAYGQPLAVTRGIFALGSDPSGVVLKYTAVPEPTTLVMALLGVGMAGNRRWRSRSRGPAVTASR